MLGIIVIVFLCLFLFGGFAPWGRYPGRAHFYGGGPYLGGGLGLVLVIVLILVLLGKV